jgi:lactoylglutathione lyase
MSDSTKTPTTVVNIGVAMFSVADQDAALAFYTQKLGYEVRSDMRFGENDAMRWLEVAPAGSAARLAINPPMSGPPGGGSIGVETPDVHAEYARLQAIEGVDIDADILQAPGVPTMFSVRDPDGNSIWIVETPAEQ